jgi:hypothetical protein
MANGIKIVPVLVVAFNFFLLPSKIKRNETETIPNLKEIKIEEEL